MRRSLQFATAILSLSFAATMLTAQSHSKSAGGGSTSEHSTGSTNARSSNGAAPAHSTAPAPHRAISTTPTPGKPDPFHQPVHLPGGGGCYNCGYGYGTYGGYVYGGYAGTYSTNPVGPTATDRILANGGTFNNINDANDEQQQPAPQSAPIYIRPEYSTRYATDNSTVNTPIQNNVASASSDSPAILIFKDGRNLTIRNYAIYGAFIVVLTPERQKFPIAAIDVPATEKANEAAGYELKIPAVFTSH
jgi:hypothetical protein